MTRNRIWLSAVFLLAGYASALPADTHVQWDASWVPDYQLFTCNSALAIRTSWSAEGLPDVLLGVETDPKLQGQVHAAVATLPVAPVPAGSKFKDVSARLIQSEPCVLSFAASNEHRRQVVHVRTAPNQRVALMINGQTSVNIVVGEGAIVYDGEVLLDKGALYVLRAMAVAYSRSFKTNREEVVRNPQGKYFITPVGFRNHLTDAPDIGFASRLSDDGCCGKAIVATFKVGISPNGDVVLMSPTNVPPESAARLSAMVSALKLKPFLSAGTPVYAEGFLQFLLEPSGRVSFLQ